MFRLTSIWVVAGTLFLVLIYAFDVGHGFVKDDFVWILTSRVDNLGDVRGLMNAATGFFRPVVSLSFTINHALFGVRPLAYGLTNLALFLACTGTAMALFRAVGLGRGAAVGAGLVWGLNFQGINMAVLWISGRTALLVTLFSVAAAWAWTRGRRLLATVLVMTAMWSKEEAFAMPAILTAWSIVDVRSGAAQAVVRSWPLWLAAGASLVARFESGAYTPSSAPPYYQYQFDIETLAGNLVGYADRVATTAALALVIFWVAAGAPGLGRKSPAGGSDGLESRRIFKGVIWTVLSLVPTILLPVRSSLYAVLPSVGVMLIAGSLAERIAVRATPNALRRAVAVISLLFVLLLPVYRIRNSRYVNEAELSAAIVAELANIGSEHPGGGLVVIEDSRDVRPTAEQALGSLADRAAQLATNGRLHAWINPAPAELTGSARPDLKTVATLIVEGGAVRRMN